MSSETDHDANQNAPDAKAKRRRTKRAVLALVLVAVPLALLLGWSLWTHANRKSGDHGNGPLDPNAGNTHRFALSTATGTVLISDADITSYDWASHVLTFKDGVKDRFVTELRSANLIHGTPFTVTADGVACYRGMFVSSFSSASNSAPVIVLDSLDERLAANQLAITLGYPTEKFFRGTDPRGDERIKQVLTALGKVK